LRTRATPVLGALVALALTACATTYQRCVKKARGGKGGYRTVCTDYTDQQQVAYNARKFNTGIDLFFAVRGMPLGAFLPSNYKGTP
jgi:hypothetical protein